MLVLILGFGTFEVYQVMTMEDQLDDITQTVDQMDGKVKHAQNEKAKFYSLAKAVLLLAPKNPNAEQIATYYKFKELQAAQPELMAQTTSPDSDMTNAAPEQPIAVTNSAPVVPSEATNAAPLPAPAGSLSK
jgi:hypothetical protein